MVEHHTYTTLSSELAPQQQPQSCRFRWRVAVTAAVAVAALLMVLGLAPSPSRNSLTDAPTYIEHFVPYNGAYYKYTLFSYLDNTRFIIFEDVKETYYDDYYNPNLQSNTVAWDERSWSMSYVYENKKAFTYSYSRFWKTLTINGKVYSVHQDCAFLVSVEARQVTRIWADLSSLSTESIDSVTQFATNQTDVLNFFATIN